MINKEVEFYIMFGMITISQFHIYHLLTENGTLHEALKEFYENVQDNLDMFSESTIANYTIEPSSYEVNLYMTYDEGLIQDELDAFKTITSNLISKFESPETKGIQYSLIEIQKSCDKLQFKLGLD